ncbi:MAG TPA: sulfurtransferase TusA family protein [Candidatus Solibacter sp.]|jgi:TusA-related sulfurtransferase|nr:sulfurtransferase TusA family protein [Candidatus Solibacter sp.]
MDAEPLDLRGTRCPLNYVKTRLRLERMEVGQRLEVWLDHGEPEEQVPRSLRMDGQEVSLMGTEGDWARFEVVRRA